MGIDQPEESEGGWESSRFRVRQGGLDPPLSPLIKGGNYHASPLDKGGQRGVSIPPLIRGDKGGSYPHLVREQDTR